MGRGHLSRALLIAAAVAAAAAGMAAAATGVRWTVLQTGRTEGVGARPVGYIAVTKAQEAQFASRIGGAHTLAQVNLQRTAVVAVFLDGVPCGRDISVTRVARTGSTLTITVNWTRPPIGVAACVRINTPYAVIGVTRASLGHSTPAHVKVVAIARS